MNKTPAKLTLLASALAASFLFAAPMLRAEDTTAPAAETKTEKTVDKKAERKAKHEAEMLKKYDKNGNGVLDPDELAAMKADQDKNKADHKRKQHKKDGDAN
jgi:2,3-bisphosphoglycerate-independent phosphoglycerate mutase